MSLAIIHSRASLGIDAPPISIEVHISTGLPQLILVGLPETAVKESRDRVRSALINSGFTFPSQRITINLAPADLPKEGGRYDLPIALGILAASGQIPIDSVKSYEFIGELALSGEIRAVQGAISSAVAAKKCRRQLILPQANQNEIALLEENTALVAGHLLQICEYLHTGAALPTVISTADHCTTAQTQDLQDIIGQEHGKRALEIAASGGHNLLLLGPPGTGKTMLAERLITLLPDLTLSEAIQSAMIHSLTQSLNYNHSWRKRSFRAPHHNASIAALVGGGSIPKPGEISLAHNGVLFLDELPEFSRKLLDAMRSPLESGNVEISRANAKVTFPARFQLIAAMNPSPTGHYKGEQSRSSPQQVLRYLNRLSGPFLDRFDMSVEIPLLPKGMLSSTIASGESSHEIKQRVIHCRECQLARAGKLNAHLASNEVKRDCTLAKEDAIFLEEAITKLGLSVRAWHRILKVSRTLADLEKIDTIKRHHLAEALSYRAMERLLNYLRQK